MLDFECQLDFSLFVVKNFMIWGIFKGKSVCQGASVLNSTVFLGVLVIRRLKFDLPPYCCKICTLKKRDKLMMKRYKAFSIIFFSIALPRASQILKKNARKSYRVPHTRKLLPLIFSINFSVSFEAKFSAIFLFLPTFQAPEKII